VAGVVGDCDDGVGVWGVARGVVAGALVVVGCGGECPGGAGAGAASAGISPVDAGDGVCGVGGNDVV